MWNPALVMGHRYRSSALRDLLLILKVFLVSGCLGVTCVTSDEAPLKELV